MSSFQSLDLFLQKVKSLCEELGKRKSGKNESVGNPPKNNDPSNLLQPQGRTLDQLKSHLDNVLHSGYDLGLYGLSLGVISLRKHFRSMSAVVTMSNQNEKDLYDKITNKLDCLIEDHLERLPDKRPIRFSGKVLKLEKLIRENQSGQTIVFVERVYTAEFLCQVLRNIFGDSMQIEYITGSKTGLDSGTISVRQQVKRDRGG